MWPKSTWHSVHSDVDDVDDVAGVACAAVGRVHERDFVTKTVFIFVTKAGALNHPKKEVTKTGQNNLIASKKLNSVQHVEPNLNILSCYILSIALGAFLVASKLQV